MSIYDIDDLWDVEFADLMHELERETGSHLYTDLVGQDIAMTLAERATWVHASAAVNRWRDRDAYPDPVALHSLMFAPVEESVTDAEREAAAAYLAEHSAIR